MFEVIIVLIVVGVLLWLVNTYIPMDPLFKKLIVVVAVICIVIYLLKVFGIWGHHNDIPVPSLR